MIENCDLVSGCFWTIVVFHRINFILLRPPVIVWPISTAFWLHQRHYLGAMDIWLRRALYMIFCAFWHFSESILLRHSVQNWLFIVFKQHFCVENCLSTPFSSETGIPMTLFLMYLAVFKRFEMVCSLTSNDNVCFILRLTWLFINWCLQFFIFKHFWSFFMRFIFQVKIMVFKRWNNFLYISSPWSMNTITFLK